MEPLGIIEDIGSALVTSSVELLSHPLGLQGEDKVREPFPVWRFHGKLSFEDIRHNDHRSLPQILPQAAATLPCSQGVYSRSPLDLLQTTGNTLRQELPPDAAGAIN